MKRTNSLFLLPFLIFSLALAGCGDISISNSEPGISETDARYQIYIKAQAAGYEGTYEEWLASIKGADGTSTLNGISDPTSDIGIDGDTYINTTTWDFFVKSGGNWVKAGNIMGPKGDKGDTGEQGPAGEDGQDGQTPYIGENGNWWIGDIDTEIPATGSQGETGEQGPVGNDGVSVVSIEKTSSEGLVDTYTITYSDGTTSTFTVANGGQGIQGEKGEDGHTPVISIGENGNWYVDGVDTNIHAQGIQGVPGQDGQTPYIGENGNWWIGITDTGVRATPYVYTVTFDPNNGDASFTQEVIENKKAAKPNDPVKDGYIFDGWYADTDEKWVFAGYPVTDDMKLTAQYTLAIFTVTLNANEGYIDGPYSVEVEYQAEYALPEPTKYGHRFGGWEDENGNIVPLSGIYNYTANLSLIAKWNPLFTVTFDSDGGSACEPIHKFDYDPIEVLPIPEKDGEMFNGWYIGEVKAETPFTPDDYESVTLVAHWKLASEEFEFHIINDGLEVEILSYIGTDTLVTIPNTINMLPVTSIAADAFLNNTTITNVDGSSNLTSIGNNSFKGCTSLVELNFPGLDSIGESALLGASSLESLSIGSPTFSLLPAFDFEEINMPNSFDTIQMNQNFSSENMNVLFKSLNTKLFNVIIGNQVTAISFTENKIVKEVAFKDGSTINSIDYQAFSGCTSLTSITIPSSVTSIGHQAFSSCGSLTSITIPSSVTSIGEWAFSGCTSLTSITIPSSVTSISGWAFRSCSSLVSITIPSSVTSIGNNAFSYCENLQKVYYAGTRSSWFNNVSIGSNNESLINANISFESVVNNIEFVNDGTFEFLLANNNELIILECIDKTVTEINLETYFSEYNVISIGNYAFYNCTSLTSITIPSSVTSIGEWTFSSCYSLTSITIPSSVTSIGHQAFSSCGSLTSITIPSSVTSIGNYAFYNCGSLTIYAEAPSKPTGWNAEWNPNNAPVVWGYTS